MQLFDEQGRSVDALSPEEVEQRLQEAREQAIEEANASRQGEIDDLTIQITAKEAEIEESKGELEREKGKEKNLSGQRKVIEEKEKVIDELKTKLGTLETTITQKFGELEQTKKNETVYAKIESLSAGDKEMASKIKFYYDTFKGEPGNDKEVEDRIQNAYTLATGGRGGNPLSSRVIFSEGMGAVPDVNPKGEKLNSEGQDLAHKMGVSDQELKKHKLI